MVNRLKVDPFFDIKSMGFSFFVPLAAYCILFYQLLTYNGYDTAIFKMMEFFIIPLSGWWVMYLFYDYYEEGVKELLFTYPLNHWEHGFIRIHLFFGLYLGILAISIVMIHNVVLDTGLSSLLIQYVSEAILVAYGSFALMNIFKSVNITLMLVGVYVATEFLTMGNVIPWYHVMFFNTSPLAINEVLDKGILNVCLGGVMLTIAQVFIRKGANK